MPEQVTVRQRVEHLWQNGVDFYDNKLKTVREAGKGLVAVHEPVNTIRMKLTKTAWGTPTYLYPTYETMKGRVFVFFPKPKHAEAFRNNHEQNVRGGGPAENYPGSVGSLHQIMMDVPTITVVQGHYKQVDETGLSSKPPRLTRNIATQYGGWRQHLMEAFFESANSVQRVRILKEAGWLNAAKTREIFFEKARKHGFTEIKVDESGWTASKPNNLNQ